MDTRSLPAPQPYLQNLRGISIEASTKTSYKSRERPEGMYTQSMSVPRPYPLSRSASGKGLSGSIDILTYASLHRTHPNPITWCRVSQEMSFKKNVISVSQSPERSVGKSRNLRISEPVPSETRNLKISRRLRLLYMTEYS